ncbi:C-type lectin domain family 4 member D-like [Seriola lalandi dorsalis]|uniref:C-type lectin domain family 4 member D-like n=1 Tax=Seriola lalandi dorsalis TaxID=1841481 RepID=A0A3B4YUJ9_SERLL|nr:C-type lectin domain family 4 member D-like [Seriola lalandi dorsalis]XP_056236328.1 C-type lectin domain family 4 member D-like [Seriola aureovittata]
MNLIKTKGALGIRGHIMRYVLIGLLVSEAISQAASSPEEEVALLKLRLNSLKTRYKDLCNQYSSLAANCSAPGLTCSECPPQWFQVGDKCFHIRTDKRDWLDSENNCTASGGHLAILTTREEHEAVEKESRRIGGFYKDYWIGLTDAETEGEWKWVDKSNLTNSFWDSLKSEPDNNQSGGPEGEDCVVVDGHSQTWFDVPCTFLYPRICQMDAIPLK